MSNQPFIDTLEKIRTRLAAAEAQQKSNAAEVETLRKRCAELEKRDAEHLEALNIVYLQGAYSRNDEVRALQAELKALKEARP